MIRQMKTPTGRGCTTRKAEVKIHGNTFQATLPAKQQHGFRFATTDQSSEYRQSLIAKGIIKPVTGINPIDIVDNRAA